MNFHAQARYKPLPQMSKILQKKSIVFFQIISHRLVALVHSFHFLFKHNQLNRQFSTWKNIISLREEICTTFQNSGEQSDDHSHCFFTTFLFALPNFQKNNITLMSLLNIFKISSIMKIYSLIEFSLGNFLLILSTFDQLKVIIWLIQMFKKNLPSFRIQPHYRMNKFRMNLIQSFFIHILLLSNWSMISTNWTISLYSLSIDDSSLDAQR